MVHVSALTPPLGDKKDFRGGDADISHEDRGKLEDNNWDVMGI